MKETSRQYRNNTEELEQYIREVEEKEKQKWKETLGLFLLSLISLGGLIWILVFGQDMGPQKAEFPLTKERVVPSSTVITAKDSPATPLYRLRKNELSQANPPVAAEKTNVNIEPAPAKKIPDWELAVSGTREPYQKIVFTVQPYDPDYTYRIDFGDGRQKYMYGPDMRYAYPRPGNYQVKVHISSLKKHVKTLRTTLAISD